jgi:transcriptional regulator with XRE-family HTH domain
VSTRQAGGEIDVHDQHGAVSWFSRRLDALFVAARKSGTDKGYSVREVAAALGWSHTHLNNLRSGRAPDPRLTEMRALAEFFGVPITYFTDPPQDQPDSDVHTRLLAALADPAIKAAALRMVEADLSPAGAAAIVTMIEQVQLLERAARRRDGQSSASDQA